MKDLNDMMMKRDRLLTEKAELERLIREQEAEIVKELIDRHDYELFNVNWARMRRAYG